MRRLWQTLSFSAAVLLTVGAPVSAVAESRVALLVAHPFGGEGLLPLRYTSNDLERMREVLETLGGFDTVIVSYGEDADQVAQRFYEARESLSGRDDIFVFYYSGHAKDGELRLGETRLALTEVNDLIADSGAALRIGLLDSCRSGGITRLKGVQKGAPVAIRVDEAVTQNGTVLITASSDNEDAQESDAIQGSFFTHYVTSGLRGAADENLDGDVTLAEAYSYAYAYTVSRTIGSRGGIQHPTYRFDLRGAGDVVLTRTVSPPSAIVFPASAAGSFVVFDTERKVVVAEIDKAPGQPARLGVVPGSYVVKKRERDHVKLAQLTVRSKGEARVEPSAMERVDFEDDYAKGATVSVTDVLTGPTEMRLSMGILNQTFLSSPVRNELLPNMALLSVTWDIDNALRKNVGVAFDIALGGSGVQQLSTDDPFLGRIEYDSTVSQLSAGAALTGRAALYSDWLSAHGALRLGIVRIGREFNDGSAPSQALSTFTPGVGAGLAARVTSWLSIGAQLRLHYMFFNLDENRSLAFLDGGGTLSFHL
ncbi:MAG: caspase family protein [Myxococcota bacterium]